METTKEILLTNAEIKSIENFVLKNPMLRAENLINFGNDFKTVFKVSPINGLIFIKGNEFTGFEHINQRHSYWTKRPFKKNQNNSQSKLDNPSKFSRESIPILDYVKIADSIYKPRNLKHDLNKRPSLFDYYLGGFHHSSGQSAEYILLTYKNSKVVHSLFPKTKKNNPKTTRHFNFIKGSVSAKLHLATDLLEISIPYLNSKNITLYTILIRRNNSNRIEKAYIITHNRKGEQYKATYLGEKEFVKIDNIDKLLAQHEYTDLTYFEKQILRIENNK